MNLIEAFRKSDCMTVIRNGKTVYVTGDSLVNLSTKDQYTFFYSNIMADDWEPVMAEPELLPCKFCGEEKNLKVLSSYLSSTYYAECEVCKATGPFSTSPKNAAAAWNVVLLSPDELKEKENYEKAVADAQCC